MHLAVTKKRFAKLGKLDTAPEHKEWQHEGWQVAQTEKLTDNKGLGGGGGRNGVSLNLLKAG